MVLNLGLLVWRDEARIMHNDYNIANFLNFGRIHIPEQLLFLSLPHLRPVDNRKGTVKIYKNGYIFLEDLEIDYCTISLTPDNFHICTPGRVGDHLMVGLTSPRIQLIRSESRARGPKYIEKYGMDFSVDLPWGGSGWTCSLFWMLLESNSTVQKMGHIMSILSTSRKAITGRYPVF